MDVAVSVHISRHCIQMKGVGENARGRTHRHFRHGRKQEAATLIQFCSLIPLRFVFIPGSVIPDLQATDKAVPHSAGASPPESAAVTVALCSGLGTPDFTAEECQGQGVNTHSHSLSHSFTHRVSHSYTHTLTHS